MKRTICLLFIVAMMGLPSYNSILQYGIKKLMAKTRIEKSTNFFKGNLHIPKYGPTLNLTSIMGPLP